MLNALFSKATGGLFLTGGLACMAAYRLIGSTVDNDGFLQEPFALIPLGWFFLLSGTIAGGLCLFRHMRNTG